MPLKIKPIEMSLEADHCFLLCDTTGNYVPSCSAARWAPSLIQCLDQAVDAPPSIILVRFGQVMVQEREALVELCALLKRNSRTCGCLVLALMHSKHRKLIEDLDRIKVDYARYVGDDRLDFDQLQKIIQGLSFSDGLKQRLSELCPFLHYDPLDSRHELITCRAFRDRMVLGGRWLHEKCETGSHIKCEYYLNPRIQS